MLKTARDEKKQAILDAAVKVFAQYGYHNAKMAKIAETAGVGAGSLYLHYENKADMLRQIFETAWARMTGQMERLISRRDLDPQEKLGALVDLVFDLFSHDTALATVFVNEQQNWSQIAGTAMDSYQDLFLDKAETLITDGQQAGRFNPDISPKNFRHFVFGGIRRTLHAWANQPDDFPLNRLRQDLKVFIRQSIRVT